MQRGLQWRGAGQGHHAQSSLRDDFDTRGAGDRGALNRYRVNPDPDRNILRSDDTAGSAGVGSGDETSRGWSGDVMTGRRSREAQRYAETSVRYERNQGDASREKHSFHYSQPRVVDRSKTTCTMYIQADHLFYQKFDSNEERVIEQLTQHVQGVNEIYRSIGKYNIYLG